MSKDDRINLRVEEGQRTSWEAAAAIMDKSLPEWCRKMLDEAAAEITSNPDKYRPKSVTGVRR